MPTITIEKDGTKFECNDGDTILRAALRAGVGMPYSCNVGSCGNCRFELLEGEVRHLREDPPAWSERDLKRNRWLGCQAEALGPCSIKLRTDSAYIPNSPPVKRTGKLVSVTPVTHDIAEFSFAVDGPDDFLAGQYALLEVPAVAGARAYSMCNLPGTGHWNFQIKKMPGGAATGKLFDHLKDGDTVNFDGPYGTAFLQETSARDIVLLAGGSGLSPMVSIAKAAATSGMLESRKLYFFYGGKGPHDMVDIIKVCGLQEFADRIVCVSAMSGDDAGTVTDVPVGFIHDIARDELAESLVDCEIYFAGPAVMSAAVQKMLFEMKVPMTQIHFDEFY